MQDWTDLKIAVPAERCGDAAAIAGLIAPDGLYIEDYSALEETVLEIAHIDLIDEELLLKDRQTAVIHLYLSPESSPAEPVSFLGCRLEAAGIPFSLTAGNLREEDWATAWKRYYHPLEVSPRLAICPSWEAFSPREGQIVLRLDPGMAFGTGTHETTRLCLELLEAALRPGMSMLDVGCGSGILAIAAKMLGSGETVAADIDPLAVRVAAENAERNGVSLDLRCGDLAEQVSGTFDVVCANIVADAIIRLAPSLPALMKPSSAFIASGIIAERRADVETALRAAGLCPKEAREDKGWCAVLSSPAGSGA